MTGRRPLPAEERAMLQSVVYSSLFDYPLTATQLSQTLIGAVADEPTLLGWFTGSARLRHALEYVDGYFFPRGRRDLLATRSRRDVASRTLLKELAGPLRLIMRMPFVRMVALSGSLAHLNAEADADLDLFVITRPHRVWTTTVVTLALARLLGVRKRLCLNYVISQHALWVAPADLFSANQIVHLQPLVGRTTFAQFLDANRFVMRFYPNFRPKPVAREAERASWFEALLNLTVAPLSEPVCRFIYRQHLRRRAHTWTSRDQVRLADECLKLHTHSHRHEVMERFERALDEAAADAECDLTESVTTREESRPWLASL